MAEIRRRQGKKGRVTYSAVIRLPGKASMTQTFRRRSDAVTWAGSTEAAIREDRLDPAAAGRRVTLAKLVADYEASVLAERQGVDARQRRRHLRWWVEQLGAFCRVTAVTQPAIVECRERLRRGEGPSGKPAAPATRVRYLASLSHLFTFAIELKLLKENPCRGVKRPREPQGRLVSLSAEQRASLLEAAQASSDGRLYPLVVLALSTAARQAELCGLRWSDIDLGRRIAVIEKTKNGERRALPLASLALDLLRQRVRRLDTDLLFADERGRPTFPRKAWEVARAAAGLPALRFHDLRHAALSELAMSGATLSELAAIAGHKTLAMVRRYQHLTEAHVGAVVERMNDRLFA